MENTKLSRPISGVGFSATGKYLIIIEQEAMDIFSVFELPELAYKGGFSKTGRGPSEFIALDSRSGEATTDGLKICDVNTGFVFISLKDFSKNKSFTISKIIKLSGALRPLNDATQINDSIIIGLPYPQSNKLIIDEPFVRYNSNSKKNDYFGQYPNIYPKTRRSIFWEIFTRGTVVKSDNSKFASFFNQVKMFRIYKTDGTLEKEQIMKTQDDFFEGEWVRENAISYYSIVKATNNYIFAICENQHSHDLLQNKPILEIWDWNGNPIASIQMDRPVSGFDVSDDNKQIYFIDRQTMDNIFVCDLTQILK